MSILKDTIGKTKKVATNMINTAKEAVKKKIEEDRQKREAVERQFFDVFPYKHMLTLREKNTFSAKETDLWEAITKESYVVTNADEKVVYIAKEGFWLGNYKYKVTNSKKEIIGSVRRHFFNVGYPFVKERHGCTVRVAGTNEKFRLTTYLSFGEREFGGTDCTYSIFCKDKKEYAKELQITLDGKEIAYVYKLSLVDGFLSNRYVIGYNAETNENISVLIGLAIRLIMNIS